MTKLEMIKRLISLTDNNVRLFIISGHAYYQYFLEKSKSLNGIILYFYHNKGGLKKIEIKEDFKTHEILEMVDRVLVAALPDLKIWIGDKERDYLLGGLESPWGEHKDILGDIVNGSIEFIDKEGHYKEYKLIVEREENDE